MRKYPENNKLKYFLLAVIVLGMAVKLFLLDYQYIDYGFYLSRWIGEIKANGYLGALKNPFYNYTPLYMYILVLIAKLDLYPLYAIKMVSISFEYILAFFAGRLAYLYVKKETVVWLALAVIPLVPTVLLNSAFMSQCDALYATFVVGSVYFALTQKQWAAMIFLGIAFSLKIQTAIILPFYFVYLLRGHIKWYMFLVVPAVYLVSVLPVWMAGRPLTDLLTIYVGQAEYNVELVKNFPNIYWWIGGLGQGAKLIGLLAVVVLTLGGGWILRQKRYAFTLEMWYTLLLLSAVVCPFFLPGMLERYMYLGDIFAVLYVLINHKKLFTGIGIIFVSFYSYVRCIYMFSFSGEALYPSLPFSVFEAIPWEVVSIFYFALIILIFRDFVYVLHRNGKTL